jgi:hypothetical protein
MLGGFGLSFVPGDSAWRLLLGLQLVPSVAMLVGSFWMPFSPRWLVQGGHPSRDPMGKAR